MISYQKIQKSYCDFMELTGNGLNKGSHMYFCTPSQNAKKLLYYPIAVGNFRCNDKYLVERESYDSILVIYVLEGVITLEQNGIHTAGKNEVLLADCCKPHKYYAAADAHTLWVHFDGNNSLRWFDEICASKGQKIKSGRQTADCILNIIEYIKSNRNEYQLSKELYSMLCEISSENSINKKSQNAEQIEKAKYFISADYYKNITVDNMAETAHMSASFFSKVFREATGFSPYDYLLSIRLDKAKELLQKTDDSVQNIAFKTGFNSVSNFICFFKKETGISPLKFRNIRF